MVQHYLLPYRWSFHYLLATNLRQAGVKYRLITGTPEPHREQSSHVVYAPVLSLRNVVFQNIFHLTKDDNLVIMTQAVKQASLYPMFARHMLTRQKLALWGHGKNFQARNADSIEEKLKRWMTKRAHWFFSYNNLSTQVVEDIGFPAERITNMMNAIDTTALATARAGLTDEDLDRVRKSLGISSDNVAVYTGAMYPDKRMPFLLEACILIRKLVPDFEMIFIGGGEDASLIQKAAEAKPWIHYIGFRQNEEKVPYWAISKLFLMPGAVGLVILDAFALETPMITTAVTTHGPEIDYLEDARNGLMVPNPDSVDDFANAAARLLQNETGRMKLVEGCRLSAPEYTVEKSAKLFSEGILQALAAPHYRGGRQN